MATEREKDGQKEMGSVKKEVETDGGQTKRIKDYSPKKKKDSLALFIMIFNGLATRRVSDCEFWG